MDRVVSYPAPAPLREPIVEVLDALGVEWGALRTTTRTLLDTFDGRIHRADLELSVVETDGCQLRLWGERLSTVTVDATNPPRLIGEIPSAFVRHHVAFVAPRALLPIVATTTTTRVGELRAPDGTLAARVQLHDDLRDAATGAPQLDLVVELDLRPGHEGVTRRLRKRLERLHLVPAPGSALSELIRVLDIDPAAHHPTRVDLDRTMPAIDGVRLVLTHLATTVVEHRAGTIAEVDVEFLHDLRIAVRRTRTVLRHARRLLPDDVFASAREDFAWLGAATGPPRDLDVAVAAWDRDVAALGEGATTALAPLRARLEERRELAHRELAAALASARFDAALGAWQSWLIEAPDPATLPDHADRPLGRFVARRLQRAHERLIEHGRRIDGDSPPEQLHELRKDAKALRYLFDCFTGLIPGDTARPLLRPLKRLLTTLGEHQDSDVRLAELDDIVRSLGRRRRPAATDAAIAALRGLLDARREAARAEFGHRFRALDQRAAHRALVETVTRLRR